MLTLMLRMREAASGPCRALHIASRGFGQALMTVNCLCSWVRATVTGVQDDGCTVAVLAEAGWTAELAAGECHVQNERDDTLDDLVKSDYLHEAG